MIKILLVIFAITACKGVRTDSDTKFITIAQDDPKGFARENILIKRVHERHWDIFYRFSPDCPANRKIERNYRGLRRELEKLIKMWLAPLKEVARRPIVNRFVFHKSRDDDPYRPKNGKNVEYEITATFRCEIGRSAADRRAREIIIREGVPRKEFANRLRYRHLAVLHELGHAFELADTYVGNLSFSPPSTGGSKETIGSQPHSVMSSQGCFNGDDVKLCLDDVRAIQWLYRYHWENLDPTKCPPEFVYEKLKKGRRTVGGCVYRQPLIVELRQGHVQRAENLLKDDKNLKINEKDKHGYAALHYSALTYSASNVRQFIREILKYPRINLNITDKYGNTPLHWATWFGNVEMVWWMLFTDGGGTVKRAGTAINRKNKTGEVALHSAARLGKEQCTEFLLRRADIRVNIKENRYGNTPLHEAAKTGHTKVVKLLLKHRNINRNIRNKAQKTARELAKINGHTETVRAFD